MLLDRLIVPLTSIAYKITKTKEKRLNYKLKLNDLSEEWLQGEMAIEMDDVWKREGLDAIGTNYFTIGAIKNGVSTRFDPNSAYYQAWLGGYIVKFSSNKDWTINDHFNLGVADQKNWLILYGDNQPFVEIEKSSVEDLGELTICGFRGRLYKGIINSDSDVGDGYITTYKKALLAGMTYYINKSNPKLRLTTENLIPEWTNKEILRPYQKIILTGYIAILQLPDNIKAVLYVNSSDYTDINNDSHQNFKWVGKNPLEELKNIKILKT